MKWFVALCVDNPFGGEPYRNAVVVEANSEKQAVAKFIPHLPDQYKLMPVQSIQLKNWGATNVFAYVRKIFLARGKSAEAGFAVMHHTGQTVQELESYLQNDWHGMGVDDMSHVSVWDYHPEELADMVDGNEVRAHLFEVDFLSVAYVKTIQLLRR